MITGWGRAGEGQALNPPVRPNLSPSKILDIKRTVTATKALPGGSARA